MSASGSDTRVAFARRDRRLELEALIAEAIGDVLAGPPATVCVAIDEAAEKIAGYFINMTSEQRRGLRERLGQVRLLYRAPPRHGARA